VVRTTGDGIDDGLVEDGRGGRLTAQVEQPFWTAGRMWPFTVSRICRPRPRGLTVAAVPERRWPEDALWHWDGYVAGRSGGRGSRGTSSPRRIALLRSMRPDLTIEPVRGNVPLDYARSMPGSLMQLLSHGPDWSDLRGRTDFANPRPNVVCPCSCTGRPGCTMPQRRPPYGRVARRPRTRTHASGCGRRTGGACGVAPGLPRPVASRSLETEGRCGSRISSGYEGRNVIRKEMQGPAARGRK